MRKQGRPLTREEREIFKPYFAYIVIENARIIDGDVPIWLRRDMCAVVLKNKIFLRPGVYRPNTPQGVKLLGHELTHVSQFLHGMTLLKYIWSCRNGYYLSKYEVDARNRGELICRNFLCKK